jgi:hypothetical protein
MVHHAILKRCFGNQAWLGIENAKAVVRPGSIDFLPKLTGNFSEVILAKILELYDLRSVALAPARLAIGGVDIFQRDNSLVKILGCHVFLQSSENRDSEARGARETPGAQHRPKTEVVVAV